MKWYEFFTWTGVVALGVFGMYAQHIGRFLFHPWFRVVAMSLLGVAILASEWMILEDDCRGDMKTWR